MFGVSSQSLTTWFQEAIAAFQRGHRIVHMFNNMVHGDYMKQIKLIVKIFDTTLMNLKTLTSSTHTRNRIGVHLHSQPTTGSRDI